jgi:steroid 5-alpha reductase family enzyme
MFFAFATSAIVVFVFMSCIFLVALAIKDNSIVDIAYGAAFVTVAVSLAGRWGVGHPRQALLLVMVAIWGLRLTVHLLVRSRGRGEDFRYRKWRETWGRSFVIRSFLQIYMLQGMIILVVSFPVIMGISRPGSSLGPLDLAGVSVWFTGLFFEAVGDWQLLFFNKNPANKGRIMTTGLWRFTRHPNYFGEATLWWGIYLVALGSHGAWWTFISPLTIDFLLLKVSGIPMLEKRYEGEPAFEEYKKRTSPFVPWFQGKLPGKGTYG